MTDHQANNNQAPVEKFRKIIELLILPADTELAEYQRELYSIDLSDLKTIHLEIEKFNTILRQNNSLLLPEKFIYIFIAHSYTLSCLSGRKQQLIIAIKAAQKALRYSKSENDDYHCALYYWYLGLLFCCANKPGISCTHFEKARNLLIDIQELYLGVQNKNKHEIRFIEEDVESDLEIAAHWVNAPSKEISVEECPEPEPGSTLLDYLDQQLNNLNHPPEITPQ
ncbi:MAG: hypothetical protein JXA13_03785 [Anaerolineales bacterium]|nr:hypothetical protein [Anaerolineales bacterium]